MSNLSCSCNSAKKIVCDNCYDQKCIRKTDLDDLAEEGFEIEKVLGEGTYCKVRLARYRGRKIAVKVINKRDVSEDFQKKFLPREIQVLSEIKHPNIVDIYRIYKYPHRVYIFMELIRGGNLMTHIRIRRWLRENEAFQYFQQVISAVKYLHAKNIAHRDLKCDNIMITNSDQVKLIDFGFCRLTRDVNGRRVLSTTFCGSAAYAAPEVLRGIPYNPMMYDVWSLGCVLFVMVTGTLPFDDSHHLKMVSYQMNRLYYYPDPFLLTKEVKSVISRMLEPDVTKRATIDHISRSSWIRENQERLTSTKSVDRGKPRQQTATVHNDPSGSRSQSHGTQTVPKRFDISQWIPKVRNNNGS